MQPRNTNTNGPRARAGCENDSYNLRQANRSNSAEQSQPANPSAIASERAILGASLEDDDLIMPDVIASGLRSSDFFLSDYKRIFAAILQLWQEQKHVDAILVLERLGNRAEDAAIVADCITGCIVHPDHISTHIEIVQDKAQRRAMLRLSEWIPKVVNDPVPADALIEQAIQKLEAIAAPEVRG